MIDSTDKSGRLREGWRNPASRRRYGVRAAGLLLLLLVLVKVIPMISSIPFFSASEEEAVLEVNGVVVQPEHLDDRISASGTIRAIQEVDLSSEVSGKVIGLHIEEGSEVRRGRLLVKVNDNDLQAKKSRLESNIEMMEQTVERQRQLFERGGATQEDYDNSVMQLNNLRAELIAVEAMIERTEVRAPFDGVVGLTYISEGAYVTPSTRIASLQDMGRVRIDFSIPERYSSEIRPGSSIQFRVQAADSLFEGRVTATEPQIDPRTRTLQVRAVSDNEGRLLRPGAYADIDLILRTFDTALMIPSRAVVPDAGEYHVMAYRDGRAYRQPVKLGIRTRNQVQITEGLAAGDTVLVSGLLQVRDGSPVELVTVEQSHSDE